jgi:hypothetical protein
VKKHQTPLREKAPPKEHLPTTRHIEEVNRITIIENHGTIYSVYVSYM